MLSSFIATVTSREQGFIDPKRLGERLCLTDEAMANLACVHRNTLQRSPFSPTVQEHLAPIATIIARVQGMTQNETNAITWFLYQPIPAFGGKTPRELVKNNQAADVQRYLDDLDDGNFA